MVQGFVKVAITLTACPKKGLHYILQYFPYQNQYQFAGIDIRKVNGINIGERNVGIGNTFSRMLNGIYCENSNTGIYGNTFSHILSILSMPGNIIPKSGAIVASNIDPANVYPFSALTVGLYPEANDNNFNNCVTGIYSYNLLNHLDRNSFYDCSRPIVVIDPINNSRIVANVISTSETPLLGTGITVNSFYVYPNGIDLDVSGNTIYNMTTGIDMTNQKGVWSHFPKVYYNTIQWQILSQYTGRLTGIKLYECNWSNLFANLIEHHNYTPTAADVNTVRGIKISQSQGALIQSNMLKNLGSGISTTGSLISTQFKCNTFSDCWHGLFFDYNTALSNQGYCKQNKCMLNHNKFSGTYDLNNSQAKLAQASTNPPSIINGPKSWIYNTDEGIEYQIDIYGSLNTCWSYIIGVPTINGSYACKNVPDWMEFDKIGDTNDREDYFGPIVRNEYLYGQFQEEFKWYERSYLLDMILGDTTLLTMGGFDDYLYQQIFDSLNNGSCGQVNGLFHLLRERQYYFAGQLNEEIFADRLWLGNIQDVTRIYLNTIALGIMEFDSIQLQTLWPIALSIPYEGGPAVYTARVMLGIDPEDYYIPYSTLVSDKPMTNISLYPNPANSNVTVKSDGIIDAGSIFELYSATGKLVLATKINESCSEIIISLGSLSAGLYFCNLNNKKERSKVNKLVILR